MRASLILACMLLVYVVCGQQYPSRDYGTREGLAHSNVYRIFQDHKGFLWFCTDYGISRFDGRRFSSEFNSQTDLLNTPVLSVSEDESGRMLISSLKENLIILTDSTLSKYVLKGDQIPGGLFYAVSFHNRKWLIGRGKVSKQQLYEVNEYNVKTYYAANSSGKAVFINNIVPYANELLLTGSNGLYRITDTVPVPFLQSIVREEVRDVCRAKDGTYWIGLRSKIIQVKDNRLIHEYPLPENQYVNDLLADRNDNIWIALKDEGLLLINKGVLRNITKKLVFRSIFVNDMLEDFEGNIWIATYGAGVYRINSLNMVNYPMGGDKVNIFCRSLCKADNGRILLATIGKVSIWEHDTIKPLEIKLLKPSTYIYFIRFIDGLIYIGTPEGLLVRELNYPYRENFIANKTKDGAISMCRDGKGAIWIGGYNHLFRLKGKELIMDSLSMASDHKRYTALLDHRSNLWCGTSSGLFLRNASLKNIPPFSWLKNQAINDLLEDQQHRLWIATDHGLLCIDKNSFRLFREINGLTSNKCNKLEEAGNILWVGTLKGISYIQLDNLKADRYGAGIYPDEVLSLCSLDSNTLFAGTVNSLTSIKTGFVHEKKEPPPLYIVSAKTNSGLINMPREVNLPYRDNKLIIGFIGLSYQNAEMIDYRYRISNLSNGWHYTQNTSIELPSLPSGDYRFALNARINNGPWSPGAILSVHVSTPFWKTWEFLTGFLLLLALVLYLVTKRQVLKQEAKKQHQLALYNKIVYLKQQALSALINPHFIFNCMNSIQHYLNNRDHHNATNYLADFAYLIRMTLEDAQEAFINLDKELERIRLYLSLEELRFGETLRYEIRVDADLDVASIRIPNMILQPYIENAIWHGVMPKNGGHILIQFMQHGPEELKIIIEDDGVGYVNNKVPAQNAEDKRYGMSLTEERLHLLKLLSNQPYTIEVKAPNDATRDRLGTSIEIVLPARPREHVLNQFEEGVKKPV